jgi:hypothetical protein
MKEHDDDFDGEDKETSDDDYDDDVRAK